MTVFLNTCFSVWQLDVGLGPWDRDCEIFCFSASLAPYKDSEGLMRNLRKMLKTVRMSKIEKGDNDGGEGKM